MLKILYDFELVKMFGDESRSIKQTIAFRYLAGDALGTPIPSLELSPGHKSSEPLDRKSVV